MPLTPYTGVGSGFGTSQPPTTINPPDQSTWNPQYQAPAVNHFDVSTGRAGQNALDLQGLNLFDPQTLAQIQQILSPYFQQQDANLTRNFMDTRNALSSEAGQNAGAIAAFRGQDPTSFVANAQSRTNSSLAPSYFQALGGVREGQLENLFNAGAQSSQFQAGNLQGAAGINQGLANLFLNRDQFSEQMDNQPGLLDYLFAGLGGAAGGFLGGIGTGLGNQWGTPTPPKAP